MATDYKGREIKPERIKYFSCYQRNWPAVIPPLRKFVYQSAKHLTIHGDAPKNFINKYEYKQGVIRQGKPEEWPGFIAKVGAKFYPNESITEHLLTRIGQLLELEIADSELRIVGNQVRFMSRYFLRSDESLVHGAELFMRLLEDRRIVNEITEARKEKEFFTFQTICEAVKDAFPEEEAQIISGLVQMIAFDAIIGHNDRHAFNWGVIVPTSKRKPACFAPIFDTARAFFWNVPERRITQMVTDKKQFEGYLDGSSPQIGWDGHKDIGHFELVEALYRTRPQNRADLEKLVRRDIFDKVDEVIEAEFGELMTPDRRRLIKECFRVRYQRYRQSIQTIQRGNI